MKLGACHVETPFIELGQISTVLYFSYFVLIVPVISLIENTLVDFSFINGSKINLTLSSSNTINYSPKIFKRSFHATQPRRADFLQVAQDLANNLVVLDVVVHMKAALIQIKQGAGVYSDYANLDKAVDFLNNYQLNINQCIQGSNIDIPVNSKNLINDENIVDGLQALETDFEAEIKIIRHAKYEAALDNYGFSASTRSKVLPHMCLKNVD